MATVVHTLCHRVLVDDPMGDEPRSLAGIRVVIAEDHDATRDILEHAFRHMGAVVTAVATVGEALGLVATADIIVTDLVMRGADGVWLLEQVNRQPRRIPVIVVSGVAESQEPRLAQAPFARKLLKPIDPWVLAEVIVEVLHGRP